MKLVGMFLMLALLLVPALSDARCRTVGESASIGTEYGTLPVIPGETPCGSRRETR